MTFSVATWNINSVRLRIDLVVRYLLEHQPDVLCLQETKCPDGNFPFGAFRDAGYPHIAINGQKGYHGVAIVSRMPLATFSKRDFCAKGDARHLHVVLGGEAQGLELHNFYVPAGGDEPDPEINVKFAHKLAFVDEMVDWASAREAGGATIDPGRRSQHRAARARRLEPQVASQRCEPHAHRGRQTDPGSGRGPLGRRAAQIRARQREALHLVELSLARLAEGQQGTAVGPYLGQPGARRFRERDARSARRPRLGAPIRPRAGHDKIRIVAVVTFRTGREL